MSKTNSVSVVKSKRATKPFRKTLRARVEAGTASVRVMRLDGKKPAYVVGVQVGGTIHLYSDHLTTMTQAKLRAHIAFGVKAVEYRRKAA